jgi:hypothetical protein
MVPYASLSEALDSGTKAVQILKAGEVTTRKAELAKHIWVVQGHAQYRLLGDFPQTFGAEGDPNDADVAVFQNLEAELMAYADLDDTAAYGGFFDKIDWKKLVALLIKIAPLFLETE